MLKLVPTTKCPLDILLNLGTQTKDSMIYLGKNAINKLRSTSDANKGRELIWNATDDSSSVSVTFSPVCVDWFKVTSVVVDGVALITANSHPQMVISIELEN